MKVWQFALLFLVLSTGASALIHTLAHGFNWIQCALAFFLWLNLLICVTEIALFLRIDRIHDLHLRIKSGERSPELKKAVSFANNPISLSTMFSPDVWEDMWVGYSFNDPSYANRESFGFFGDIGNGFSTLIPSFLLLIGMTAPILSARVLGIIGLLFCYQIFFQTALYYVSYFFNKRHVGLPLRSLILWVGGTNSVWIIFPLLGFVVFLQMILTNRFDILW